MVPGHMTHLHDAAMINLFSIEFLEPGRRHSTLLDYPTLDAARMSATGLMAAKLATQVVGIIQWDLSLRKPDLEWVLLPDGGMTPLSFCSKAIH